MQGFELRRKLRNGERVYGTHIIEAGNPNYLLWLAEEEIDFAFICSEHIPLDRKEVAWMCQLLAQRGVSPMVRIPYPAAHWASMFLDAGAQGIVVPYVETCEEVEAAIGAVRYRPIKGRKLTDLMSGRVTPSEKLADFLREFNHDNYLIIGIESVPAIENLDALLDYDEVDAVFLGPHDITCSLEIPTEYDNPLFVETMERVIKTCRDHGKGVGIHQDHRLPSISALIDEGLNFILNASDVMKGKARLAEDFTALRKRFGDTYSDPDLDGEVSPNTGEVM